MTEQWTSGDRRQALTHSILPVRKTMRSLPHAQVDEHLDPRKTTLLVEPSINYRCPLRSGIISSVKGASVMMVSNVGRRRTCPARGHPLQFGKQLPAARSEEFR